MRALALFVLAAVGCSRSAPQVTVFAAASLRDAFEAIGKEFTETPVVFQFAGSPTLATQIEQGAPADVFASADEATMARVRKDARVFARNRLAIVVGTGNPKGVKTLADLARPGLLVSLCAPAVPAGKYAREALDKAHVSVTPRSLEENVRGVVSKVALGEVDAGIAYVTDVRSGVVAVDIPDAENVLATYPIVALTPRKESAAFVDFVLGPAGQRILASRGFLKP